MTRRLLNLFAAVTTAAAAALVVVPAAEGSTLYVAPQGSGGACSSDAPCGSFASAYRAARPGDLILVRNGSYGKQAIPALGRPAPAIEFRAAPGASPVAAGIDVNADWVTLRGLRSSSYLDLEGHGSDPIEHVTFINMHTHTHLLLGARDFLWKGGSIGPSFNDKASMIGGTPTSYRATYDGVLWHDATRNSQDVHMECLFAAGVQGLTIRNSHFRNCAVFDILLTKLDGDPQPRDVVIENTVFEESKDVNGTSAYYTMMVHEVVDLNSIVLRNNVWQLPWYNGGRIRGGRVVGNIGYADWSGSCQDGVKYAHNVFTVKKCGSTDKVAAGIFSQFLGLARGDFRLKPGSAAIDAGDPNDHPALDAAGNLRVAGRAPDAGPYEFGSHPPGGSGKGGSPAKKHGPRWARVLGVLDGRTLRVRLRGGPKVKVRLAGIAGAGKRRCGPSPRARLTFIAPKGSRVKISFRTGGPARDKQSHRLAYVRRKGRDLGHRLIAHGAARFNGNARLSHQAAYKLAQKQAKSRRLGLWSC